MANIFQTTSGGYRDANKALTIKALEARQKAALDAKAAALQPTTIADPLQGIAGMMDVLGAGMQQRRADRDTSEARNTLAKLKAGITDYSHIDPNTLSQIGTLDPDAEKWLTEQQLKIQDREDTQTFTHGENELSRGATASESEKQRQAQIDLQNDQQAAQAEQDRIKAENEVKTATTLAERQAAEKRLEEASTAAAQAADDKRASDEAQRKEQLPQTNVGKIEQDYRNKVYGEPGTPEAIRLRDEAIKKENTVTGGMGGPAGLKAMQDWQLEGNKYARGLDDINEAKMLIPKALTGTIGRKIAELAASGGEAGIALAEGASSYLPDFITNKFPELKGLSRDQIQATVRLYQITDNIANTQIGATLKGASSDREMANFQKIFSSSTATPEAKMQALLGMERSFSESRDIVSNTITSAGGQALNPYKYVPLDSGMNPATSDTSSETTPADPKDPLGIRKKKTP